MTRKIITIILLFSYLGSLTGCKRAASPPCPIELGIVLPETGSSVSVAGGEEQRKGYDLAVKEVNRTGGILGCQVKLIYADSASTSRGAQVAAKSLIENKKLALLLGAYSSTSTILAAGVAEAYNVPMIVSTASSELITEAGYEWVFRINATSVAYAQTTMNYLQSLQTQGIRIDTIAIIFEDTAFGQSAAVAAAQAAQERGIHIVAYEVYKRGTPEQEQIDLLLRVKDENPSAVYMAAYLNDAKMLMQKSYAVDLNPTLFIGNAGGFASKGFISIPEAEYVLVTTQWERDVAWPGAPRFTEKFILEYGEQPPMRSAATYTAVLVAKDAIERAHQTLSQDNTPLHWKTNVDTASAQWHTAIRTALNNTDMPSTIFGPIRFDENGQNPHETMLVQILDGQYITIYPEAHRAQSPIVPVPPWDSR